MEQPVYSWDPVIAPSGATFYPGSAFPEWRGDLLVGSLRPGGLVRLRLEHDRVVLEARYLAELDERIRDVRQGPDRGLYLLTGETRVRIFRLYPIRRGCPPRRRSRAAMPATRIARGAAATP